MGLSEELSSEWDDKGLKVLWVSFLSDYSSSKKFKRILKWLNQKWKERNWERTELHLMWIIFVSNIHWKGILGHVRCNNKSVQLNWFTDSQNRLFALETTLHKQWKLISFVFFLLKMKNETPLMNNIFKICVIPRIRKMEK